MESDRFNAGGQVVDPQDVQTARTFDSYKDTYSDSVNAAVSFTGLTVDFYTRVKADYLLDVSRSHFGSTAVLSALDVGCGIGNCHAQLFPQLKSLSGVDISSASLDTARARNAGVDYRVYDGKVLPYPDASFDLAFTICVMHHVPPGRWRTFAQEMHRVLRPGGLALIFEHNPRNLLTKRVVKSCPFDEDAVLMRREMTEHLYCDAGFKQVYGRFILSVPPANSFLRRLDQLLSGFPLGAQYYVAATA
jgi:SAM-dependent methyltransferase